MLIIDEHGEFLQATTTSLALLQYPAIRLLGARVIYRSPKTNRRKEGTLWAVQYGTHNVRIKDRKSIVTAMPAWRIISIILRPERQDQ